MSVKRRSGFSLIEAIVSLWIMGILLMSVAVINTSVASRGNQRKLQAMDLARGELESCISAVRHTKPFYTTDKEDADLNAFFVKHRPNSLNGWEYSYSKTVVLSDKSEVETLKARESSAEQQDDTEKGQKPYLIFVKITARDATDSFESDQLPDTASVMLVYHIDIKVSWVDNSMKKDDAGMRDITLLGSAFEKVIIKDLF